jgi:integrase
MNLTAKRVLKVLKHPGRYGDGHGLTLVVKGPNNASWSLRYQRDGVEHWHGLGPIHTVSLGEARILAREARFKLLAGVDPIEARKAAKVQRALAAAKMMTFSEAARLFLQQHGDKWSNAEHARQWSATLKTYAEPVIGRLPVSEIDVPLVLRVLEQPMEAERGLPAGTFWATRTETANRLRGRIEQILDWAKARGYRTGDNPAAWSIIGKVLPARDAQQPHTPDLMRELRQRPGSDTRALEFLIYTAARSQEVLKARWSEIDFDAPGGPIWTVPAMRMKMRKEHRVPLSPEAVELLRSLPREGGPDGYLFVGPSPGKPLGMPALRGVLERLGRDVTVHGMRSAFRDWAGERTAFAHEVCEAALATSKAKSCAPMRAATCSISAAS